MIGWTNVQSSGSETGLRRIMSFMHLKHLMKKTMKIRSKHNDLLNYFVHDKRDLSPAYVRKCELFLWSLRNAGLITKPQANTLFKMQASSSKRQALATIKRYKKL